MAVLPLPMPDAGRRVFTVSELTRAVKDTLEGRFGGLWVEGEISNLRSHTSGHVYFTLKDEEAQIRAVLFRSRVRRVRFEPADGLHVLAFGRLDVYAVRGEYQLVCEVLEPKGLGALQLAFEQLKARLAAEGLFDPARKRPLPALPRRVGLVTSPTGAAVRDFLRIVTRRFAGLQVLVCPVRVQGDTAAARDRRGAPDPEPPRRPRRDRAGPGRRLARGPLGVQRGGGRPGDRGVEDPGHLRGRARDGRHDRRLRGRPPGAHAVGRRRAGRAREDRARAPARHAPGPARPGDRPARGAPRRPAGRLPPPPRAHGPGPAAPRLGAARGRSRPPARRAR